ncbi:AGZA family xanthine/uracil permease-like MFS transporter [Natronocella acetinitrilica]|uniref:AGZA family xanthine/uracil permease-like MFS transporter n=1 Tax=Natronocella acetinitrilica TaxID=414046 RepID=A0AAE3G7F7_9GAMM|nr:NCS2 family permease [Natronocella acetinitrilica]MCP1675222.1 AGZA family xanthine/uracil permease-like MFS transporter [Natronocella acetinitrilica]
MDKFFGFTEQGTSLRQEIIAGATTFLAMAYILFVNAFILADAGMDPGAVFVATALSAAAGCLIMGLWANYPIALAPGMGLNAFFAYTVVLGMGVPWETALAGVLVSGIIFLILTVTRVRETIINAIPLQLKMAAGAGIGLFIAFIGLKNAGIVEGYEPTLVTLGNLGAAGPAIAIAGLLITAFFLVRGFKGAIFYGMVVTTVGGIIIGVVGAPDAVVSAVPSLAPTFGQAIIHLPDILLSPTLWVVVFTFLFVDFFDTAGTLMAVAHQGGFLKDNKLPRASRALGADSSATVIGAVLGTSTTTSYIESAAGVGAGGRTGFTSVVVAALFLVSLFFSPLLQIFLEHPELTSPALIIVGVLMASALANIDWKAPEFAIPAFVTVIAMPLTFSIANGIALGFVLYPLTMVFKGKAREVHPLMYAMFVVFIVYFIWGR